MKCNLNDEELEYLNDFKKELEELKSTLNGSDEIKWWIKSFKEVVNANKFYISTVCEGDLMNYYQRNFKLFKGIKSHSIVYVNLGCGFPKELRYGHFAYVYKVIDGKALIIPLVSIKKFDRDLKAFELAIVIINHGMVTPSLMRMDEMRWIDIQRINESRAVPEQVQTPRWVIESSIKQYLDFK